MRIIYNHKWGDNFNPGSDAMTQTVKIIPWGTTDDGAIILKCAKGNIYVALIPVSEYLWIKLCYRNDRINRTYMSYVIECIEDIICNLRLDNDWHIIRGQSIVNGHGLTKAFKDLEPNIEGLGQEV